MSATGSSMSDPATSTEKTAVTSPRRPSSRSGPGPARSTRAASMAAVEGG